MNLWLYDTSQKVQNVKICESEHADIVLAVCAVVMDSSYRLQRELVFITQSKDRISTTVATEFRQEFV